METKQKKPKQNEEEEKYLPGFCGRNYLANDQEFVRRASLRIGICHSEKPPPRSMLGQFWVGDTVLTPGPKLPVVCQVL